MLIWSNFRTIYLYAGSCLLRPMNAYCILLGCIKFWNIFEFSVVVIVSLLWWHKVLLYRLKYKVTQRALPTVKKASFMRIATTSKYGNSKDRSSWRRVKMSSSCFFYKTCRMCVALVRKVGRNVSSNILQM